MSVRLVEENSDKKSSLLNDGKRFFIKFQEFLLEWLNELSFTNTYYSASSKYSKFASENQFSYSFDY